MGTRLAGLAALTASVALPVCAHAAVLDLTTKNGTMVGTVTEDIVSSDQIDVSVALNKGDKVLGVFFTPNDKIKLESKKPTTVLLDGNGKNLKAEKTPFGDFRDDASFFGKLKRDVSFDIDTTSSTPLKLSPLANGALFVVEFENSKGHVQFAIDGGGPPSATPIPGALAMFAPVLWIGYTVLRRRRRGTGAATA